MTEPSGPGVPPSLELRGVRKDYQGLRPLRLTSLTLLAGERVALTGLDAVAAEVVVNLVTGTTLPDEGDVRVFGESTAAIASQEAWLAWLDRIGIMTDRAVLLSGSSLAQNLALPFTLEIDPVPADIQAQAEALAAEVGIAQWMNAPAAELPPEGRTRAHLARAIALGPAILVLEHPTVSLPRSAVRTFAKDVARLARDRNLAVLALTEDLDFAAAVAERVLKLDAATGALKPLRPSRWGQTPF